MGSLRSADDALDGLFADTVVVAGWAGVAISDKDHRGHGGAAGISQKVR